MESGDLVRGAIAANKNAAADYGGESDDAFYGQGGEVHGPVSPKTRIRARKSASFPKRRFMLSVRAISFLFPKDAA
jgi:hypothetical protein